MKKIALFSLLVIIFSVSAAAQFRRGITNRGVSAPERHHIRKDMMRVRMAQRMALRDGVVTPVERIRIHRLKSKTRRDAVRFRYS